MAPDSMLFGTELRRRRHAARLSLTDMTKLVHYSKSHLSKVETGVKAPSVDLARRCDAVLRCDGTLARLAGRPAAADASVPDGTDADEVWLLRLDANGGNAFTTTTRRELLAGGAALMALGVPALERRGGDGSALDVFQLMFDQLRGLGQRLPPDALVPLLVAHTHSLRDLSARSKGADQTRALLLTSRFAEYTGWMVQESGHDTAAGWWTDRAVEFAAAAGDQGMSAYALVRRALIAMYQRDATQTVVLARAAQATRSRPRIRGLAAQREAQGHAMAGDRSACFAALDRARALLAEEAEPVDQPVLGSSHVTDPVSVATGWALFDLGSPGRAAEVLREQLDRIPASAIRARTRYGARLALSLAGSGRLEEACAETEQVLDGYDDVQSATIRTDLRELARALRRWPGDEAARRAGLRLTRALQVSVPRPA